MLCVVCQLATAQSFESLKRSSGTTPLYRAVEKALSGSGSVGECLSTVAAATSFSDPYQGKTPVYLLMDYLATHPKSECAQAERVLDAFLANPKFDVNLRYSNLKPPLAYLLRENFRFLGGQYSADYISDHVLEALVTHGAKVNTYGEDGNSIMSFAIDTDNRYLQSYFVNQGIDLRHSNESGTDVVYQLIESGNLATLKQSIERGGVSIDIYSLKNEPSTFAKYPEMYEFLAQHCARQARQYGAVTLFRQRFADRKSLVQQTYETLARQETDAASTFPQISAVQSRYPDLERIYAPKMLAIYHQDVRKLETAHQKALAEAKALNIYASDDEVAKEFVRNYEKYDPDHKMPLAREVANFYTIADALSFSFGTYVHTFGWGSIQMTAPKWSGAERDANRLERGRQLIRNSSAYGFTDFYKYAESKMQERFTALRNHERDQHNKYLAKLNEYRGSSSSSSSLSSSSSSSRSRDDSSSSSSSSSGKNYSCKVHLKFSDGDEVYKGHITVYFKGALNTASLDFYTDEHGYATLKWTEDQGEIINAIFLEMNVGFNDRHTKEGLNLKDGGDYTICMDCK